MKLKPILTALAVAFAAIVQPALAEFTQDANGIPTHYNGIPIPPMQTVEEARAATEKRLAAIRAEEGKQAAEAATSSNVVNRPSDIEHIFYTGKPYLEETGQYLFLFRHYDPELSRWTTADPSGFPDGANNVTYAPVPTKEIDWLGLAVKAIYSITQRTLTIDGTKFSGLKSGDNKYENRNSIGGPIPLEPVMNFFKEKACTM
jgi:RHS repeat-associated protein